NRLEVLVGATGRVDSHSIACFDLSRGDIRTPTIQGDVAVQHELSRLPARVCKSQSIHDIVESHLEHAQQVFTRDTWHPLSVHEVFVELALEDAVDVARLLLLLQLDAELALLAAAAIAGRRAGRGWPPFHSTLWCETAITLQEEFHPLSAAQPTDRAGVTGHCAPRRASSWAGGSR